MEKINLKFSISNLNEIVDKLKNNPLAIKVIDELKISDEEIKNNYELINNYLNLNKDCVSCKSMKNCKHSIVGHRYGLKRDAENDLTDYFTICDFYKDYYKRKNNLIFTTFNEKDILDESQRQFILDNPMLLGISNIKRIIQIQNNEKVNGLYIKVNDSKIRLKLIKSLSYNLLSNHKVSIVKFSDLLKEIKAEFNNKALADIYSIVLNSDILIIDSLGNESITSWSRDEILLSLLDNRLQSDKITILCSEFEIQDLKKLYKISYNDDVKVNQLIDKITIINS